MMERFTITAKHTEHCPESHAKSPESRFPDQSSLDWIKDVKTIKYARPIENILYTIFQPKNICAFDFRIRAYHKIHCDILSKTSS